MRCGMTKRRFSLALATAACITSLFASTTASASPEVETRAVASRPWSSDVSAGMWSGSEDAPRLGGDLRVGRLLVEGPIALAADLSFGYSHLGGKSGDAES